MSLKFLLFFLFSSCAYREVYDEELHTADCKKGRKTACLILGDHYESTAQHRKATWAYGRGCFLGDERACGKTGVYLKGVEQKQRNYEKLCDKGVPKACDYLDYLKKNEVLSSRAYKNYLDRLTYFSDVQLPNTVTIPLTTRVDQEDLYTVIERGRWYCGREDQEYMERCSKKAAWGCYHKASCFIVSKGQILRAVRRKLGLSPDTYLDY